MAALHKWFVPLATAMQWFFPLATTAVESGEIENGLAHCQEPMEAYRYWVKTHALWWAKDDINLDGIHD